MTRGEVIWWVVLGEDGKPVVWVKTRDEARELARDCDARIAKVVVV